MDKSNLLLNRYSDREKDVVLRYFDLLAKTRKTGKVSPSVLEKQLKCWEGYSVRMVMEALKVHMNRYPHKKEAYTQGIMRCLSREEEQKQSGNNRRYGQGRYKGHYVGGNDGKVPF